MNIVDLQYQWDAAYIGQDSMYEVREALAEHVAYELNISEDEAERILSGEATVR